MVQHKVIMQGKFSEVYASLYFYVLSLVGNVNTRQMTKPDMGSKRIEYILEGNLLEKKCKTAILMYCFHTAGVLHIFALYNLLGPGTSFYRKSKINIKKIMK